MKQLLWMALLLSLPACVHAQYVDGNKLAEKCQASKKYFDGSNLSSAEDKFNVAFCVGYVTGVVDGMEDTVYVDIPIQVTEGQLVRVVLKYLDDHPAELHQPATQLVRKAMRQAFPGNRK